MARDFRLFASGRRFVPEDNFTDSDLVEETASDSDCGIRIVIARNPDPVACALQRKQGMPVIFRQASGPVPIVEIIAEAHHRAWIVACDDLLKPRQRRAGIIRRQEPAVARETRSFFEMQIGNTQQPLLRPVKDSLRVGA